MKRGDYEKALGKLQVQLCHLQEWVKEKGLRGVSVFEGRDGAGRAAPPRPAERASPRSSGWWPSGTVGSGKSQLTGTATCSTFRRPVRS